MKYLFINVLAGSGSTGKIAADKCRELQKQGHQCVLAYGRGEANCEDIRTYKIGTKLDYCIHGVKTRLFDRHGFGSVRATKKFLKWVRVYDPDVIWLHNIHGYYINIEMLFDYLKSTDKKVYWTLHDCWAFTGHCIYFTAVKCNKWKTQCDQCPQKGRYPSSALFSNACNNFKRKKTAFTGVNNMTLVVPSYWLESIVKESFLKKYDIAVVHNKIDANIFKPTPSNFRVRYGMENKKIVLGVANAWEDRKGLNDFVKLSKMLDDQYVIVLVGLKRSQMRKLSKRVDSFERIENTKGLAAVFTAADAFVRSSMEKPLGMTTEEAQAWITKSNGLEVGGMTIPPDINKLYDCIIKLTGGNKKKGNSSGFRCIGKLSNARELAVVYSVADVFVNPTYEDNYPTVNLEAAACGTTVITYDIGGCRETIEYNADVGNAVSKKIY